VELTESVLVDDPAGRPPDPRAARGRHLTALDDFGTGFSSIGTLRQLRFHAQGRPVLRAGL
jgi:EAL domain-containing protein (putative c-di-GMP-specific phosphodiesterase class I)